MKSQKNTKLLMASVLSTLLVPSTSAAIGSSPSIEASLVEFMNRILIYQIEPSSGAAGVLMYFVAPMVGFYFIQKNMLSYGFELFEERIERNSHHRRNEDIPSGIKGLSIVTGFITVQTLGTFGAGILFATAVLSILLGALMQFGLLQGLGGGGSSSSRSGGSSSSSSNNNNPQPQQQSGNNSSSSIDWAQLGEGAANFVNGVSGSSSSSNNNPNSNSNRNRGPKEGMDEALDMLEKIRNRKGSNKNIEKIFKVKASSLLSKIQDAESAANKAISAANVEVDETAKLEKRIERLEQDLNHMNGNLTSESNIQSEMQRLSNNDRSLEWQVQKIENEVAKIKDAEENEHQQLEDEIDELVRTAKLYAMLVGFAGRVPGSLQQFIDDDQARKEFVKEGVKRGLIRTPSGVKAGGRVAVGTPYEDMADRFKTSLENLQNELGNINTNLENCYNLLSQELKLDETEIDNVKGSIEDLTDTNKIIDQLQQEIKTNNLDSTSTGSQMFQRLQDTKNQLNNVKQELDQLKVQMGSDTEYESEMAEKIKEIYEK